MTEKTKLSPAKIALLELIRRQRARIDPKVLKIAQQAIESRTADATAKTDKSEQQTGTVPYDKEAAAEAIALFLQNKKDSHDFEKRLADLIHKNSH